MKTLAYLFTTFFLILFSGIIVFLYGLWYFGNDLPDYKELSKYNPNVVTRIHAANGALLAEHAIENRVFVPINVIPQKVINAFISAEDKDFYNHFGLDLKATLRAVFTNIKNMGSGKRLIGASTITQQVAKNFLLSSELSYKRKIKEAILAIRIERAFSKNQILELYLNEIYLGFKSYGVAAAALNYFDKSLDNLDLAESAFLAALPKAPNNYNPIFRLKQAVARRNWVLGKMNKNGYIQKNIEKLEKNKPINIKKSSGTDKAYAPYFSEEVRRILVNNNQIGRKLYVNGYSVRTTLDPILQSFADNALIEGLETLDKRQGWRGPISNLDLSKLGSEDIIKLITTIEKNIPNGRQIALVKKIFKNKVDILLSNGNIEILKLKNASWVRPQILKADKKNKLNIYLGLKPKTIGEFLKVGDVIVVKSNFKSKQYKFYSLSQIPEVNGAIVALDPHTGRVLAMSGGYNFNTSEFNRAIQAKRQPGSAFKPFVYLAGLERFYKPTELILDAPFAYDQCAGCKKWKPANYTKKRYGPTPMRLGIEKSRNLMTARLAIKLIKEENILNDHLKNGLTNKKISEKMKLDIKTINLLKAYLKTKKENKLKENKSLIRQFSIQYNVDERILVRHLRDGFTSEKIVKLTMVEPKIVRNFMNSLKHKNVIQDYALKFGINDNLPEFLSMSLGAGETDLLSLTNAYGIIVNGGKKIVPTLIDRVQDRRGITIIKNDQRNCLNCSGTNANSKIIPPIASIDTRDKVISPSSAYQMVSMLKGAVDRGTGIIVKSLKRNLAGKTGTTNSNTDAWFLGFSSDLVVGVFVGFDKPRPLGLRETGSSVAAPIFRDFMKKALEKTPDIPFRRPSGIKLISINPKTGVKANLKTKNLILEAFKPGQFPNHKYDKNFIDTQNIKNVINNLSPLY